MSLIIIISVLTIFFITSSLKTYNAYLYSRLIIFYVLGFVKCFDSFLTKKQDKPDDFDRNHQAVLMCKSILR